MHLVVVPPANGIGAVVMDNSSEAYLLVISANNYLAFNDFVVVENLPSNSVQLRNIA